MKCLLFVGILIGIHHMCSGKQCDLTIQKDGNELQDGEYVVGLGGQINQIYCKALCSGPGPTPALKWYKAPSRKPVRMFRGRVYQVRTTFDRVNILTIRNMLYSDTGTYKCRGWLRDQGWMEKSFELTYGCKGFAHLCDTSKCISDDKLCDGKVDCVDGTDEQNCKECMANQFQCSNGDCINKEFVCDSYHDCVDASDEVDCGCRPDFTCAQGGCVSMDKVCDGKLDCNVGEDEVNCTYCNEGEYHCGSKVCIATEHVCNGIDDCQDKSDESNCEIKVKVINPIEEVFEGETVRFKCEATVTMDHIKYEIEWNKQVGDMSQPLPSDGDTIVISEAKLNDTGIYVCTGRHSTSTDTDLAQLIVNQRCPGEFECSDGTCISKELVCNRQADCPGGKDEHECELCETDEFDCGDGSCVLNDVICDGNYDCANGTDEIDCCVDKFQCLDGSCVDDNRWCDGIPDCSEEEDENNCTYCEIDEFHCGLGVCIPQKEVCDKESQCADASDESNCGCYDNFACGNGTCIDLSKVCDGNIDCYEDGEDELDCVTCVDGEFDCGNGKCIDISARCDGFPNCDDGSDESMCVVCNETSEFRCKINDYCIPLVWRCDGSADCIDGSDECGCFPEEYQCNDGMCIDIKVKCDGVPDCEFEDDEENCGEEICLEGQFMCPDKSRCISTLQYCDQSQDCDDGSDESEERCGTGTSETEGKDPVVAFVSETTTENTDTTHYTDYTDIDPDDYY